jgi:hypothetical protein
MKIKERDLMAKASGSTGLSEARLQHHLQSIGKQLGPPWRQDEKSATLAAWIALAGAARTRKARASG